MLYCPSCQTQVEVTADVCPSCGWKFNRSAEKPAPSIVSPASRPKIQCEVDLAATVDRTGSSLKFQVGIPKTFEIILTQVSAKAREVKCWLASHGDLDENQRARLAAAVSRVLREAIRRRGTTLNDYRDPDSRHGGFQHQLKVDQRTGRPCFLCGTPISRIVAGQRGTHFCPRCQKG